MRALLIGSAFMEELYDHLDYFQTGILLVNESPLADDFSLLLEKAKENADCVLVDLSVCGAWLYRQAGKIMTLHSGDNAKGVFDPAVFQCTQFDKNFARFTDILAESFSPDHIFVTAASLPPYYVVQSQLRNINKAAGILEWKQSYKFIKKLEKELIKKTNATVIGLARYYFIKKPVGYDVSFVRYEELLYRDINRWFYDRQAGVEREYGIFAFKLDRFIRYQYKTIHYKGLYRFLDENNMTDRLLLSSPREYVMENYENFIRLDVLEKQLCDGELPELVQRDVELTEEFKQVVSGFLILQTGETAGYEPGVFRQMFRNAVVPGEIKKTIRNYWSQKGINPNKITNQNAGYYFAKMMNREATENEAGQFAAEHAVIDPVLADVFGSCIAYQTINEYISGATEVVHNRYYMHVPVYESSRQPMKHPKVSWEGEPADEFEKNVRIQFEHQIPEDLEKSDGEWCLIDLFSMVAPRTFLYNDFCFTDYGNKTWQRFDAQNIHPWNGYYQKLLGTPEFIEKIHSWAKWIRRRYGDRIILVDFRVSMYKIGDDNCLYAAYKNAGRKNEIIEQVYPLVKKWLDCYCIEFGKEFLADDLGYSSSGAVHYELDFYQAEGEIIQKIMAHKPEQKVYTSYPNELRVSRILRLAEKNNTSLLAQLFPGKLDRIIVTLPAEVIGRYQKEIVGFYDRGIDNRIDLLKEISLLEAEDPLGYYKLKKAVFEAEEPGGGLSGTIKANYDKMPEMDVYEKYRSRLLKNTSYTIEFYDGSNFLFSQKVIYGVKTRLLPAPPEDRTFLGWKAFRMSDQTVTCIRKDGTKAFLHEEELNEENRLYLFPDQSNVAKNSKTDGDIIRMYAVWKD